MPADTLWTFCMAVNVFLTFQTAKLKVNIKALEKWYFLFCYGLPAIPALTYLILDLGWNKDFYGNATVSLSSPIPTPTCNSTNPPFSSALVLDLQIPQPIAHHNLLWPRVDRHRNHHGPVRHHRPRDPQGTRPQSKAPTRNVQRRRWQR